MDHRGVEDASLPLTGPMEGTVEVLAGGLNWGARTRFETTMPCGPKVEDAAQTEQKKPAENDLAQRDALRRPPLKTVRG